MKKNNLGILLLVFVPLIVFTVAFFIIPLKVFAAHSRVNLLTTDNFAVLGGSAISNTPTSVITGDVGLDPAGGASITGLTCAEVTGTIYDNNGGYTGGGGGSTACRVTNAGLLTTAKNDLITAYNDAAGRTTTSTVATELGGTTLTDGTYDSASGTFGITGTLTLNGQGNADAVFIFKMATTLITASSSRVVLTNGAQACNVYWQVGSSATLGTSTTLIGNVLALTSITDSGSSTVNGRLLARNGAVTLNNTTITKQGCAAGTAGGPALAASSSPSSSSVAGSSTTSTPVSSDFPPTNTPDLFQIDRLGSTAVLYFTPVNDYLTYYYIAYGLSPGSEEFGVSFPASLSSGIVSFTINDLNPNLTYYFKVRGGNGDAPGGWSNNRASNSKNPKLPNAGMSPRKQSIQWPILMGILMSTCSVCFVYFARKREIFPFKQK